MPDQSSHESSPNPTPVTGPAPADPAPVADSVRLAREGEAAAIAALQRRAWREDLPADLADPLLAAADLDQATATWARAITRPPLAECRVLVALDGATQQLTGFASTSPSPDPDADEASDGMIGEFVVDPPARGRGHGSRLLNAAVDTLRADGYQIAQIWVRSADDALRAFLASAGWAADGSHREVGSADDATPRLRQVRLHTDIA